MAMETTMDLGELKGDVLLFGGPYSNLQASQALMDWADRTGIARSHRICTGDLVAYCADPVATVALMRARGGPVIAGNCEQQLAAAAPDCGCGFEQGSTCALLAKDWYAFANAEIEPEQRAYMAALPTRLVFRHMNRRYAVIHGGAGDISRFLWPTDRDEVFRQEIKLLQKDLGVIDGVICGHSGLAFQRRIDGVDWINAGVIGLPPHDGSPETRFAVLGAGGLRFERLNYDAATAAAAMRAAGLVQGYDRALLSGHWPSEDVLPMALRRHPRLRASG